MTYKDPTFVIIDINGVGYEVKISLNTYGQIKDQENIHLHTYLQVKEDSHTLFGFSDPKEKELFLQLISISGVGPSIGLMVLSSLGPEEAINAILTEDVRVIQSVKGIGGKTAQRIILELKDKVGKSGNSQDTINIPISSASAIRNEALQALITLGINKSAAQKSIDKILKEKGAELSLEDLIKFALKAA